MDEPSTIDDREEDLADADYLDEDDEWATDFDDHEEGLDDFDLGTYAGAWK